MNKVIQDWDKAAKLYSEFENTSQYSKFCSEFISNHFINIKNKKILDAGCGNGKHTHILSQKGGNVVGCDGSIEMLKLAKSKYPSLIFEHVNLLNQLPYSSNEFDIVLCNLVLMDIDPINLIELLKKMVSSFFLLFILHFIKLFGNEMNLASKKVSKYITTQSIQQDLWGNTMHFHRPLSYYFNKISGIGFSLKSMFEPIVYEKPKLQDIPLYLFAEFIKQ